MNMGMRFHVTAAVWAAVVSFWSSAMYAQETNPIYSLNTYGFKKITVPSNGYHMAAIPYHARPSDVNSAIGPQLTGGEGPGTSDKLILWDVDQQAYRSLYLLGDVDGTNYDYKWIDTSQDPPGVATTELVTGRGFWLRNQQPMEQRVVLVGEIVTSPTYTNVIMPGLQMIAYPYSAAIPLNDTALAHGAKAGYGLEDSDNIMLWNPDSQTFTYFYLLGDIGDTNYNFKWIDMGLDPDDVATIELQPGQAVWYRHRGTNTYEWIEPKPY